MIQPFKVRVASGHDAMLAALAFFIPFATSQSTKADRWVKGQTLDSLQSINEVGQGTFYPHEGDGLGDGYWHEGLI